MGIIVPFNKGGTTILSHNSAIVIQVNKRKPPVNLTCANDVKSAGSVLALNESNVSINP